MVPREGGVSVRNGHHNRMIHGAGRAGRGPALAGSGGAATPRIDSAGRVAGVRPDAGVGMRDLRYEMTAALAGEGLVDAAQRERVAEVCAGVAERYCAELGHTPAIRSGEIGELAHGEPAAGWAPTAPEETQRAW